ncbi:unnamed protein product [Rotaria sp. Silwood1]|nr:unnamed protein product [Rotaria sp. Silwood1]CAF1639406.1 unnamed protein product [Rotaria sp. Silwood1]
MLFKIWYNNKGWPASVGLLNVFNNALLRGVLLQKDSSVSMFDYGIIAINHPLPQIQVEINTDTLEDVITSELITVICILFALAFIPASFIVFLIDEHSTNSKHLQFISGVKGCFIIIFVAFNIESFVSRTNFVCFVLLLFLYGFALIPLMYSINYLFQTASTGFVAISSLNIFIGLMTTISTVILQTLKNEPDLIKVNNFLTKLFLIFPHYCFGRGLFDLSTNYQTNVISLRYIPGYVPKSPLQFDIVGQNIICLSIEGFVFFIFAIFVQYRFFIPDRICVRTPKDLILSNEDKDVAEERKRIYTDHNNIKGDILRIIDLVKVYGWRFGKKFTAVKKTCIGVKEGECFGLLGINGSGKSTTFKMLTGEISITNGNAFVNNYSVIKQLEAVHQHIGYCPQFDALDSLLTAREHLYFYARLHGIKRKNISFLLGISLYQYRLVSTSAQRKEFR